MIDAKVYDVTKFSALHPGGTYVLSNESVAGKDATEAFYSLHRQEILQKPSYARLQIGVIAGEESTIRHGPEEISQVPYAEPTWLASGFHSPYYNESHRKFQAAMRKFFVEFISPDAEACEQNGKTASRSVLTKMAYVGLQRLSSISHGMFLCLCISEMNIHAMRLGPGKHLKGLTLMGGLIKPEEFDYFHEARCSTMIAAILLQYLNSL